MSGMDAMQGEMPGFPFPGRPGGAHDEPLLDMIFDRRPLPPGAPQEMHDLARMLAVAGGPVEPGELAGEAAAKAAFSRFASPAGVSPPAHARARRRRSPRGSRVTARALRDRVRSAPRTTALAAALAMLICAAAAYTGILPGPLQRAAHVTVGAPAPRPSDTAARQGLHRRTAASPRPGLPADAGKHGAAGAARPRQEKPRVRDRGSRCVREPSPSQSVPGWGGIFPSGQHVTRCPGTSPGTPGSTATQAPPVPKPSASPAATPGARVTPSGGGTPGPSTGSGSSPRADRTTAAAPPDLAGALTRRSW
jgi:hypothetical protein